MRRPCDDADTVTVAPIERAHRKHGPQEQRLEALLIHRDITLPTWCEFGCFQLGCSFARVGISEKEGHKIRISKVSTPGHSEPSLPTLSHMTAKMKYSAL